MRVLLFSRTGFASVIALCVALWVGCGGGSNHGTITTVAGKNLSGFQGDGGDATLAYLNTPSGVTVDSTGNIYIADTGNSRIRKVTSGKIDTIAGNGFPTFAGDGGAATAASLKGPVAVTLDSAGNLYIADQLNHAIRKVNTAGVITTIAGTGVAGYNGDNIAATTAQLNFPSGIAVDGSGNVFISDSGNNRIREVVASTGLIQTFAGTGASGSTGDGGPATAALLASPSNIALGGSAGDLYIVDTGNNIVRKVSGGNISTVAGNKTAGNLGDGGPATSANLSNPVGIAVDSAGNFYVSDPVNSRVRKVTTDGRINNAAGINTAGFAGDSGSATSAELNGPQGLALDSKGSLYIADARNHVIRKVTY